MPTISDIGGGNNDFPDLISWGNARSNSSDLEIAHVYADQYLTSDFDHRSDFLGGYEVIGMGNDFVGDYSDAGVITITRDPSYTSWLIDDRTGRGHWKNLIIDCVDNNIVFGGGIKTFRATSVGFKGRNAPSFDEVSSSFYGIFNKCAFFTESQDAANFRYGQVELNDCILVGNFSTIYGTLRIRDMSGVLTNTLVHEDSGSLCLGADGSTVTGSVNVSTDNSASALGIGSQDASLPTYFENISNGDLRINAAGQAALPASLSWAYAGGVAAEQPVVSVSAEEVHQANVLPISVSNSISPNIAEQVESANLIDVFISQLTLSIQAQETHDATALNIEQSASQSINSIAAEQKDQVSLNSVSQSAAINSIDAQELQQANTLTLNQSAGQVVNLINAEQREQVQTLTLSQLQTLSAIVAEQMSDAGLVDVTSLQAVTMLVAQEVHEADSPAVQQYSGQLVTLITAQQINEAETLLISEVGLVDILQAEQATEGQPAAFSQVQRISTISAEQLTEAQILSLLSSGDNTNLSGLRLVPVTPKYQITPTNTTRYTLTKV